MFDFIILYLFTTCVDRLFRQITIFINVCVAFFLGIPSRPFNRQIKVKSII